MTQEMFGSIDTEKSKIDNLSIDNIQESDLGINLFSIQMVVPIDTPVEQVFDWAGLQDVINNAGGSVDIHVMNDITATGDAIVIPAGLTVYLRSNPISANTYLIYQNSTGDSSVGLHRHFIVDGELQFDNVAITRDSTLTTVGGGILIRTEGHVEMFAGGVISNNRATMYIPLTSNASEIGGGVYIINGSFTMHGGNIINNVAENSGGGIGVWSNGTIIIYDGLISGNEAGFGGGLYFSFASTLTMWNGEISGNTAGVGGGISMLSSSLFTMEGGAIINNHAFPGANGVGGGIYAAVGSSITMYDGIISENTAGSRGGGIDFRNSSPGLNSTFTMYGGEISRNEVLIMGPDNDGGGGVSLYRYVTFNMRGGEIIDNSSAFFGGGVHVDNATFNLFDGAVSRNESVWGGGGVMIVNTTMSQNTNISTFVMYDGEISGNTVTSGFGGGVYAATPFGGVGSTFIMDGGIIGGEEPEDANTAVNGGGVALENNGTFTMNSGEISGNTTIGSGGGIFFRGTTPFTMNNGEINNNQANFGGGIFVNTDSMFIMNDGEVSDNTALSQGGGIFVSGNTANTMFTMNNGVISGNDAILGGGILNTGAFIVNDGEISDNAASDSGGGVFVVGTFTANDGSITNNTAEVSGGGVFVFNGATFTMNEGEISGNIVFENGGGIFVTAAGNINISGASFIINNSAPNGEGGGIYTAAFTDYANLTLADYQNITTSATVVFSGNSAAQAYLPPAIAPQYTNIQYASTSLVGPEGYIHPINNYDINFVGNEPFITFNVYYNANGGVGSHHDIAQSGTEYTILTTEAANISRVGYTFVNWNTQPDGNGTTYMPGETIIITGNLTLYAQWEPEEEKEERDCCLIILLLLLMKCRPRKKCCCKGCCKCSCGKHIIT